MTPECVAERASLQALCSRDRALSHNALSEPCQCLSGIYFVANLSRVPAPETEPLLKQHSNPDAHAALILLEQRLTGITVSTSGAQLMHKLLPLLSTPSRSVKHTREGSVGTKTLQKS